MNAPRIVIHGTVGNIEVKQSQGGGKPWAVGSIAVKVMKPKAKWVNPSKADFKADIDTEWHNFKAWGPIVSQIAKGDHVVIFGELRVESWEKDGKKSSRSMINADEIFITDKVRTWRRGDASATPDPTPDNDPNGGNDDLPF